MYYATNEGCAPTTKCKFQLIHQKLLLRSTYISCLLLYVLCDLCTLDLYALDLCTLDLCTLDLCTLDLGTLDLCTLDLCVLDLCALDLCTLDLCALDLCALVPVAWYKQVPDRYRRGV